MICSLLSHLDHVGQMCIVYNTTTIVYTGRVGAGVSSGGIAMKMPGRVGEAAMYACGCWAADADPSLGRWGPAFPVCLCLSCISWLPLPIMQFLFTFAYHAFPVYLCLSCISCLPLPLMHFLCACAYHASPVHLCLSCISCLPLPLMHFLVTFAYHAIPVHLCLSCISCLPLPLMHFLVTFAYHAFPVCFCLSCISCLPLPIMHFLFTFAYHAFSSGWSCTLFDRIQGHFDFSYVLFALSSVVHSLSGMCRW